MTTTIGIYTKNGIVLASDTYGIVQFRDGKEQSIHSSKIFKIPFGQYLIAQAGYNDPTIAKFFENIERKCKKNNYFLIDSLDSHVKGKEFPELQEYFDEAEGNNILVFATPLRDHPGSLFCAEKYMRWKANEFQGWIATGSGGEYIKDMIRQAYDVDLTLPQTVVLTFNALSTANEKDPYSDGFEMWQIFNGKALFTPVGLKQFSSPKTIEDWAKLRIKVKDKLPKGMISKKGHDR